MTFKDDVGNKTGAVLTKSQEIFEKIFAQATREFSIRRKPKPSAQKPSATPASATPRLTGEKAKSAKASEKTVTPAKTPEKFKAGPRHKPKAKASSKKGSGVLRAGLLLIFLLVLAGYAANHFAIVDLTAIPDLVGLGPKQVVQAPIPRKKPAKAPEKTVSVPNPSQPQFYPPNNRRDFLNMPGAMKPGLDGVFDYLGQNDKNVTEGYFKVHPADKVNPRVVISLIEKE